MKKKRKHSLRVLVFPLAKAQFKLRNEGSYLGIFWYLLNPILIFLLLLGIFGNRTGQSIPLYPLYLLLGVIMYNLFQQVTSVAIKSINENKGVIKSIFFPREALVLSNILVFLYAHIFEVFVFFAIALFFGISLIGILYYLPILFLFLVFIYGLSLILAALYIYFVDLENIWNFVTRLVFFATPIFYEIGGQTRLFMINLFNPLYYFMTIARDVVIYERLPELWVLAGAGVFSLSFLIVGLLIFSKLKYKFAELI